LFHRGGGEQRLNRLLRLLGRRRAAMAALLLHGDVVAGLGRLLGRENRPGADVEREQNQTGAENGAHNLVEFEGIHRKAAPRGSGGADNGREAAAGADEYRFAWVMATRISAVIRPPAALYPGPSAARPPCTKPSSSSLPAWPRPACPASRSPISTDCR